MASIERALASPWRLPFSSFTLRHAWLPGACLALVFISVQGLGLDSRLAGFIYARGGGSWALQNHLITSTLLHTWAQRFSILLGVATLACGAASLFDTRLRPYRQGLLYVICAMLTSLLLASLGKHVIPIPCPWDLQRYGGALPWGGWLHFQAAMFNKGGCFPAGHASGGYCLWAWYFFARHYRLPAYRLYLLPGLVLGLVFGAAQELRGAHFISHDLAAMALCWFSALAWYLAIFKPPRPGV